MEMMSSLAICSSLINFSMSRILSALCTWNVMTVFVIGSDTKIRNLVLFCNNVVTLSDRKVVIRARNVSNLLISTDTCCLFYRFIHYLCVRNIAG